MNGVEREQWVVPGTVAMRRAVGFPPSTQDRRTQPIGYGFSANDIVASAERGRRWIGELVVEAANKRTARLLLAGLVQWQVVTGRRCLSGGGCGAGSPASPL